MASISIEEIQSILAARGCKDALPHQNDSEGFFLEINFEKKSKPSDFTDDEYKNKVLSVDSDYGSILIIFNEFGFLKSIEIC